LVGLAQESGEVDGGLQNADAASASVEQVGWLIQVEVGSCGGLLPLMASGLGSVEFVHMVVIFSYWSWDSRATYAEVRSAAHWSFSCSHRRYSLIPA
jgi:uncharacterized iron-regulated membrane protein